jgi:lipopolysaccharide transport system permease protein
MNNRIQHIIFHRHLLWEFLQRDLQARYVGSVMGFFWSVINPLILLAIYTVVFGALLKVPVEKMGDSMTPFDFAFYIFSGLLPWYAFQEALTRSTTSVVDHSHLIKQVRFPAKVLPTFIVLSSVINQLIGTVIMIVVLLITGKSLYFTLILYPIILLIQMVFMFGTGLLFATLHTYFRDIAPLVSIMSMILMWASPMFYAVELAKEPWQQSIIYANPITYLVEINHAIFIFGEWPTLNMWIIFSVISVVSLLLGYWLFTRCHQEFADVI